MEKERLLKSLSTRSLKELAEENGVELIKKGWLSSSPITRREDILKKLVKSKELKENKILTNINRQRKKSPIQDAKPETVELFRKLYFKCYSTHPGYILDNNNETILVTNKNDMWMREADNGIFDFIKDELNKRKPDEEYEYINIQNLIKLTHLNKVADHEEEYIVVSDNIINKKHIIMSCMILGEKDIHFYNLGMIRLLLILNGRGETIVIATVNREDKEKLPKLKEVTKEKTSPKKRDIFVLWQRPFNKLVDSLYELNFFEKIWSEEAKKTEYAVFPTHRDVLLRVWDKKTNYWRPKIIELVERCIKLWNDLKIMPDIPEGAFSLIHTIQVNRSMYLSAFKSGLEIDKKLYMTIRNPDREKRHKHFAELLNNSKTRHLLSNDYAELLYNLFRVGIMLPHQLIPKIQEIREEDYELSSYIKIEPAPMPYMTGGGHPNPWVNEYRKWLETRPQADALLEEMERYQNTNEWYSDMMRKMRQR